MKGPLPKQAFKIYHCGFILETSCDISAVQTVGVLIAS